MAKFVKNDPRSKAIASKGGRAKRSTSPIKRMKKEIKEAKKEFSENLVLKFIKYSQMPVSKVNKEGEKDLTIIENIVIKALIKTNETGDLKYIHELLLYAIGKPSSQEPPPEENTAIMRFELAENKKVIENEDGEVTESKTDGEQTENRRELKNAKVYITKQ